MHAATAFVKPRYSTGRSANDLTAFGKQIYEHALNVASRPYLFVTYCQLMGVLTDTSLMSVAIKLLMTFGTGAIAFGLTRLRHQPAHPFIRQAF
jgi:hypothetical protein